MGDFFAWICVVAFCSLISWIILKKDKLHDKKIT